MDINLELYCPIYLDIDINIEFTLNSIKKNLENNSLNKKIKAMEDILLMHLKGMDVSSLFMDIIRFALPNNDHRIKRLVYLFFQTFNMCKHDGTPRDEVILVCNGLRNDLCSPNEYVRGSVLRLLSNLTIFNIIQPLIPSIIINIEHKEPYVYRNALLCLTNISERFGSDLITSSFKTIENFITSCDDVFGTVRAYKLLETCNLDLCIQFILAIESNILSLSPLIHLAILGSFEKLSSINEQIKQMMLRILTILLQFSNNNSVLFFSSNLLIKFHHINNKEEMKICCKCLIKVLLNESDLNIKMIIIDKLMKLNKLSNEILLENVLENFINELLKGLSITNLMISNKILNLIIKLCNKTNINLILKNLLNQFKKENTREFIKFQYLILQFFYQIYEKFSYPLLIILDELINYLIDNFIISFKISLLLINTINSVTVLGHTTSNGPKVSKGIKDIGTAGPSTVTDSTSPTMSTTNSTKDIGTIGPSTVTVENSTIQIAAPGKGANDTFSTTGKGANDTFSTTGKGANFTATECTTKDTSTTVTSTVTEGKGANFTLMKCTKGLRDSRVDKDLVDKIIKKIIRIIDKIKYKEVLINCLYIIGEFSQDNYFILYSYYLFNTVTPVTVSGTTASNVHEVSSTVRDTSTGVGTVGASTVTEENSTKNAAPKDIKDIKVTKDIGVNIGFGGRGPDTVTEENEFNKILINNKDILLYNTFANTLLKLIYKNNREENIEKKYIEYTCIIIIKLIEINEIYHIKRLKMILILLLGLLNNYNKYFKLISLYLQIIQNNFINFNLKHFINFNLLINFNDFFLSNAGVSGGANVTDGPNGTSVRNDTKGTNVLKLNNLNEINELDEINKLNKFDKLNYNKIHQFTSLTDPIYVEGYIKLIGNKIYFNINIENRSNEILQNISLDLSTGTNMQLISNMLMNRKMIKLLPNEIITTQVKFRIDSSTNEIVYGYVYYSTCNTILLQCLSFNPLHISLYNFIHKNYISGQQFRHYWNDFQWENVIKLINIKLKPIELIKIIIKFTHMTIIHDFSHYGVTYHGKNRFLNGVHSDGIQGSNRILGLGMEGLDSGIGIGMEGIGDYKGLGFDSVDSGLDGVDGLDRELEGYELNEIELEELKEKLLNESFLSINFFLKTIFDEEAIANLSLVKKENNTYSGCFRIRSREQNLAIGLGDRIAMVTREIAI